MDLADADTDQALADVDEAEARETYRRAATKAGTGPEDQAQST